MSEAGFIDVLKNRDFTKLLGGQFFSNAGDAILQIAIYLYVLEFTGSLAVTTTVLALQILPWIIVGPVVGVLADRMSRKLIMVSADLLRAVVIAFVPMLTELYQIIIVVFLIGMASSAFAAPRSAVIPEIVGLKLFVKAVSLSQLLFQTMRIVGPLAAAFLYVYLDTVTFYFAAVIFLFSFFFIAITNIPRPAPKSDKLSVRVVMVDLAGGFHFLINEQVIRKILLLFAIIVIGSAFGQTLIYPFIFEFLHNADGALEDLAQSQFGIVGAVAAAGSIVGNIGFGKLEHLFGRVNAIVFGTLSLGVYYFAFSFISTFEMILIFALISGIFGGAMSLAINAIFAEVVPNSIRARAYSATNSYIQVLSVITVSLSGIVAETFGVRQTLTISGLGIIVVLVIMIFWTRYFRFAGQKFVDADGNPLHGEF